MVYSYWNITWNSAVASSNSTETVSLQIHPATTSETSRTRRAPYLICRRLPRQFTPSANQRLRPLVIFRFFFAFSGHFFLIAHATPLYGHEPGWLVTQVVPSVRSHRLGCCSRMAGTKPGPILLRRTSLAGLVTPRWEVAQSADYIVCRLPVICGQRSGAINRSCYPLYEGGIRPCQLVPARLDRESHSVVDRRSYAWGVGRP